MGVRKPTFKRPYNPTRLNSNYLFHSISMMMVCVCEGGGSLVSQFPLLLQAYSDNFPYCRLIQIIPMKSYVCLLPKLKSE